MAQMNLLLHGIESPKIDPENSLRFPLREIGDKDRVDVILTNPPFGGEEEKGILSNFPDDKQTSETALLFLQLIMRKLRRPGHGSDLGGRAAVVVPNGTLFAPGISARVKEDLLKNFNLHTIVRLPEGVFAPYTDIPANLVFFDRSEPTQDIWFYQIPMPEGRKKYSKTKPMHYSEFESCLKWWNQREENDHAWKIPFSSNLKKALKEAQPHWDAAEKSKKAADKAEKTLNALVKELKIAKENKPSSAEVKQSNTEIKKAKKKIANLRVKQKAEQSIADGIYWALFNLDIKNPNPSLTS
jgi:type I restriction-modification system DNA methylase subunit